MAFNIICHVNLQIQITILAKCPNSVNYEWLAKYSIHTKYDNKLVKMVVQGGESGEKSYN